MIWFNIKALENRLKNGDITDKVIFYYLLAEVIATSIFGSMFGNNPYTTKWLQVMSVLLSLAISVIGTKRTFEINSAGDNKDYLLRYLSLSLVTGIRLCIFSILIGFPIVFGILAFDEFGILKKENYENLKELYNLTIFFLMQVFYYFLLTNSFKRVSQ